LFFRYSSSSSVLLVLDLVHILVLSVLIVYVLVHNYSSLSLSSSSSLFLNIILDTLDMILFLIYIISLIIMRLVCFDYIFSIDSLSVGVPRHLDAPVTLPYCRRLFPSPSPPPPEPYFVVGSCARGQAATGHHGASRDYLQVRASPLVLPHPSAIAGEPPLADTASLR
jgi:hypothetical protein